MRKIYFLPVLPALLLLISCEREWRDVVRGEGPIVSESRYTRSFEEITLNIPADVYIYQGNDEVVTIDAQGNVIDVIDTDVHSGELEISFADRVVVKKYERIKIYITTKDLTAVRISGSGNVYNDTPILTDELTLRISGSGEIDLHDLDTPLVDASISGSGKLYLSGFTKDETFRISGSGDIYAFNLLSEKADVNISGSGEAELMADHYLYANISGSGSIYYKGHPDIDSHISGSGRIINAN